VEAAADTTVEAAAEEAFGGAAPVVAEDDDVCSSMAAESANASLFSCSIEGETIGCNAVPVESAPDPSPSLTVCVELSGDVITRLIPRLCADGGGIAGDDDGDDVPAVPEDRDGGVFVPVVGGTPGASTDEARFDARAAARAAAASLVEAAALPSAGADDAAKFQGKVASESTPFDARRLLRT
jgi:hypothetical protein